MNSPDIDLSLKAVTDPLEASPQARVAARLERALELQRKSSAALPTAMLQLEAALAEARAAPYEIEFRTRVEVALALADAYSSAAATAQASEMLAEESSFAEKIFQITQATGTPEQKRVAAAGRVQLRDRARQVALIGAVAPEIAVKEWINGQAATLASLRGRVVLLEFWATWCKPCREMFAKLRKLDEQYRARGLDIIALTRHYFATRAVAESQAEELELMRAAVREHGLEFRVGIAEGERTQDQYGATGLPTLALIDRTGIVRYAHFGRGEDRRFDELLERCLNES